MNPAIANFNSMQDVGNASTANTAAPQNKAGGVKGFLEGLLPLAGGALGAVGGTLFGGPVGTAAGGAAGSSLGEVLREKLQGGPISAKNVLEQGAFGALPGVGSGIKALRAGGDLASLVKGTAGATEAAGAANAAQTVAQPSGLASRLYNKGIQTEANVGGFGQGAKVSGSGTQGFRQAEKISQNLAAENIPAGSAASRQIAVGDRLAQHADTITAATEAKNAPITDLQKMNMLDNIQKGILGENGNGIPGYVVGDNANAKFALSLGDQLTQVKDAKGLLQLKRNIDQQAINYGRNSAAPDPIKEQIAKVFRGELNNLHGSMVPEAKVANGAYSNLADANEFLKGEAAKNTATTQGGEGITARVINAGRNTVGSRAGQVMQTAGKSLGAVPGEAGVAPGITGAAEQALPGVTAGTAPQPLGNTAQLLTNLTSPRTVGGAMVKQAIPRSIIGAVSGSNQTPQLPGATANTNSDISSLLGGTPTQSGAPGTTTDLTGQAGNTAPASPYPLANYLNDVSSDPKNEAKYTALYKELNPTTKPTANAQNAVLAAENTNAQLSAYQSALKQAGGSQGGILGTISKLAGESGVVNTPQAGAAAAVNQARNDLGAQIAKLVTGSGRPAESVIQHYTDLVPTVTDTSSAAQAKFTYINSLINDMKNNAQGTSSGSSSGVDLTSLAAALQGQ